MTSSMDQIKTSYETLGMTVEEIAKDQQLEVPSIKATLMNCSSKYRKDVGSVDENDGNNGLDFTNDELRMVNRGIMQIALTAEDEGVRLKAQMYVRDDKKGRREVARLIQGNNTFNVLTFNMQLQQAKQATAEMIKKASAKQLVEV